MESKIYHTVTTNTRVLSWIAPNIIRIQYNDHVNVDLDEAVKDSEVFLKFTERKRVKKLIVSGTYTAMQREARSFIGENNKKNKDLIEAEAIVIVLMAQRLLANFYYQFVKNDYPVKVYSSEIEAEAWLRSI